MQNWMKGLGQNQSRARVYLTHTYSYYSRKRGVSLGYQDTIEKIKTWIVDEE